MQVNLELARREQPRGKMLHVLIGTSDTDYDDLRGASTGGVVPDWVVPKSAVPGDQVAFFVRSVGFVATGNVASSPESAHFNRRLVYRAAVANVVALGTPVPIERVARAIPDWNWTTYPRTYTTPPPSVAERLLGLLETEAASLPQAPAPAFLFGWNPEQRNPESLAVAVTEVEERGATTLAWRSGNRRSLPINSRAFLIRLGAEPRGIIGVGWTRSDPNDEPAVDIEFQVLREEPIVPFATLQLPPFSDFQWSIQASGVAIPTALAADLDASVKRHIAAYTVDLVDLDLFEEGSQVPRSHLVTERDKKVVREKREDTLRRTGKLACEVCDFDFSLHTESAAVLSARCITLSLSR